MTVKNLRLQALQPLTGTTNVILFDSSMKQTGILDVEVEIRYRQRRALRRLSSRVGGRLVNGHGGPAAPAAAQNLCEQVAAQGYSGAMFALGAMCGGGFAPRRNEATARRN